MTTESSALTAPSGRLAELLLVDDRTPTRWSDADLAAMLEAQLRRTLRDELGAVRGAGRLSSSAAGVTFAHALTAPEADIESVRAIHRFAKFMRSDPLAGLPEELATVLYFAAIAAARVHHGLTISTLDAAAVRNGLAWCLGRAWLSDDLSQLCRTARDAEPA